MRSMQVIGFFVAAVLACASSAWADVTVEVSPAGDLVVTGDDAGNSILILQELPGSDSFLVIGPAAGTTLVNGEPWVEVTGVTRNVDIRMGAGPDNVFLRDAVIPRDVHGDGGDGGNFVMLESVDVGRNVRVRNGTEEDTVRLHEVTVGGKVDIDNGDGGAYDGSDPTLGPVAGTHIHFSTIDGRVRIRNGTGSDYVHLRESTLGDDLHVDHGEGSGEAGGALGGTTDLEASTIAGDMTVENGYGHDRLAIASSSIGGKLRVDNGDGSGGTSGAVGGSTSIKASTFGGKVVIENGYGRDSLTIRSSSIQGALEVDNGEGSGGLPSADGGRTELSSTTIQGDVKVRNAFGFDSLGLYSCVVEGDLEIDNGTGGSYTFVGGTTTIQHNLELRFEDGPNDVNLSSCVVEGDLKLRGGEDAEVLRAYRVVIGGKAKIDTRGGDDRVRVDSSSTGKGFDANGGAGTDTFEDGGENTWPPKGVRLKRFETVLP